MKNCPVIGTRGHSERYRPPFYSPFHLVRSLPLWYSIAQQNETLDDFVEWSICFRWKVPQQQILWSIDVDSAIENQMRSFSTQPGWFTTNDSAMNDVTLETFQSIRKPIQEIQTDNAALVANQLINSFRFNWDVNHEIRLIRRQQCFSKIAIDGYPNLSASTSKWQNQIDSNDDDHCMVNSNVLIWCARLPLNGKTQIATQSFSWYVNYAIWCLCWNQHWCTTDLS